MSRLFRLSLTIKDDEEFKGAHAVLALVHEEGNPVPMLAVQAGGFPADNEGAGELADMLRDAASAIDEHLNRPRERTDTASLPTTAVPPQPRRPRFNPKPRGE